MVSIGRFYKVLILPRYPCRIPQTGQQTNNKALNQQITINLTRKQDLNNNKTLIKTQPTVVIANYNEQKPLIIFTF